MHIPASQDVTFWSPSCQKVWQTYILGPSSTITYFNNEQFKRGTWKVLFKGTTRGLSGVFLPLVMNPLWPLKYYDRSIISPWSFAMAIITHFVAIENCFIICFSCSMVFWGIPCNMSWEYLMRISPWGIPWKCYQWHQGLLNTLVAPSVTFLLWQF